MNTANPFDLPAGSKGKGWIEVSRLPGGRVVGIPWMAVKGLETGPTLTANCGVHGDEYEGGEAIRQIWRELDPGKLTGTWLGIPVVNIAAYEVGQRVSPLDAVNLNRIFPGDGTPSITGMLARRYFNEIVLKSDAVLDFHAGGNPLSLVPVVAFSGGSKESLELAKRTGIALLWEMPTIWSGSLCMAASQVGVPTVTPEIGNNGRLDPPYVDMSRRIILNVMISMGMCEGERYQSEEQRVIRGGFAHSGVGGLFQPVVSLGEEVERGQLLATIRDVFGETLEEVRSPCSGILCAYRTIPPILPGDQTVFVGEVVETL